MLLKILKIWNFIAAVADRLNRLLDPPRDIMLVMVDIIDGQESVECQDWLSNRISPLCGKRTAQRWNEIKQHCSKDTRIYIWAGMERKHLAYNEHIAPYLEDEKLLHTGNGFHYGSGRHYELKHLESVNCPTCGQFAPKLISRSEGV